MPEPLWGSGRAEVRAEGTNTASTTQGGVGRTRSSSPADLTGRDVQREPRHAATHRWTILGALAALVTLPLLLSGPGNDLDVANVFRSGRAIVRHGTYLPSRAPGSPVHEAIIGTLDLVGGPLLTNIASLGAGVAVLWALDILLSQHGVGPNRRWALAIAAFNPWFVIAATSSADYLFALAFTLWAAVGLRAGYTVSSGLLAALAMGCRIGSAALIAAIFVAELTATSTTGWSTPRRLRTLLSALVAAIASAILFVPSFLAAGGLEFASNDFSTSSPLVQLGRAGAKNLTLLGTIGTLAAIAALPAVVRLVRSEWRSAWVVRFAIVGLVLSQALFARFPWKMAHLLPCLAVGVLLLGAALADRPRFLMALAMLQLLFCFVQVEVLRPDDPNRATGARLDLSVDWGPVVIDWQCRREHPDAHRGRQKVEVEAAWKCAQPFSNE